MRFPCNRLARLLIIAGLLLLLLLLLPDDIWPFCLALGLIGAGICLLKR